MSIARLPFVFVERGFRLYSHEHQRTLYENVYLSLVK